MLRWFCILQAHVRYVDTPADGRHETYRVWEQHEVLCQRRPMDIPQQANLTLTVGQVSQWLAVHIIQIRTEINGVHDCCTKAARNTCVHHACERSTFAPLRNFQPPRPKLYAEWANSWRNDLYDGALLTSTVSEGAFHRGSNSCAKSSRERRCWPLPRPAKWKMMEASIGVNSE